ncbi:MAG: hypothetical protein ACKVRP_05455 [Bacteroidota bacterium]
MRKHGGMRPHDIAILLKIVVLGSQNWRMTDLASTLHMSQSEISESLNRCMIARLIDESKRIVYRKALLEFLMHGVKYVFPAQPGALVRGMPTAHSALPLSAIIISEKDVYVWPWERGSLRGQGIEPLYKNVPLAAQADESFHEMLALVDALRVGRAREQAIAEKELSQRINNGY